MPRKSLTAICVAVAVFALLASTLAHADVQNSADSDESVRFAQLVKIGDRARLARRNNEALTAYNNALDIRRDPAVEGRLGLILESGDSAWAAENLLRAITKAQAPPYLMQQFHDAFKRVRPKVCFVEVFVSEQDAAVLIDGKPEEGSGINAFHLFVTAGSHTFQAKLDGFEDTTETIDIPAGGELQVRLELKRLPPPPPKREEVKPNPDPKPAVVGKPPNRLSDSYAHFYVGAGAVVVLGATPGVTVGPQITGGVRWKFVSVGVDARVAWVAGTLETAPDLRFVTWAAGVRPCVHYAFLFGCGLVQVGELRSLSKGFVPQTRFGGGLRGGVEFVLRKPFHLQLWAEGIVHSKGYSVVRNAQGAWEGGPVFGGFGATTFLTW